MPFGRSAQWASKKCSCFSGAASSGWGLYCATKFAVEGITEALAQELAPLGIHATVIEPGFFRTEFLAGGSLGRVRREIGDYAATVGAVREFANGHDGAQPGDPRQLAQVILNTATVIEFDFAVIESRLPASTLQRIVEATSRRMLDFPSLVRSTPAVRVGHVGRPAAA